MPRKSKKKQSKKNARKANKKVSRVTKKAHRAKKPRLLSKPSKSKKNSGNGVYKKELREKIHEMVIKGRKLFDQGDYDQALPLLKKVNELGNNLADILNMMGLIYHYKGKFNKALQAFEEALSINPNYTEASLNLAVTCNDLGRFKEAKYVYSRAKSTARPAGTLDPYVKGKLANMHAEIADVYCALGHYVEASEEFRKALNLRPTFIDIQTKLGVSLRESGCKDESLRILKTVYKGSPEYTPAAINLGLTYFSMGHTHEAVQVWQSVLSRDPKDEKAKMYLRLVSND